MEKSVRVAEREYSKRMAELNRGFEVRGRHCYRFLIEGKSEVGNSFSGMEDRMNEVSSTAVRIGLYMPLGMTLIAE